jgi:hypothetical protein
MDFRGTSIQTDKGAPIKLPGRLIQRGDGMRELVWTVMAGASAAALLYGAWLVLAELVRGRADPSAKRVDQPGAHSAAAAFAARSSTGSVRLERRSGVERRSSQRQAAERIAA